MQHGLAQWLAYLSDKPLPILNRTKVEVQSLIDQAQLSITQYAAPIHFDSGFSAYFFSHVNKQRVSAKKNPLTTLDNALSHLGQSAFQAFLNNAPLLEELKLSEENTQGYMRTMGNACHAALQAKNWAQQRDMPSEETQLAALLQNITELMLWCYGDTAMQQIEYLCYVKKKAYEEAAKSVLGCAMRELGAALSEKLNLPEMVGDGLRSRHDNFTLATGVSLASELARIVSQNWYGKQSTEIIRRIAKYKAKAEGEIEHRLHLNAVDMTDMLMENGYAAPARLLPLLADDRYIDAKFMQPEKAEKVSAPTKKSAQKTPAKIQPMETQQAEIQRAARGIATPPPVKQVAKSNLPDLAKEKATSVKKSKPVVSGAIKKIPEENKKPSVNAELGEAIKTFQLMVAQGKPAHDLIEQAVKACLLCGVQRCVFLVKVPKQNVLVSRYIEHAPGVELVNSLKIPLNNPHVFSLLMEKSRNLFLNKTNYTKYWKSVPDPVKLAIRVKQFFAMSIFANAHAMGLMYADKVKGELTQEEFVQFQGICRLLSKGIVQSAQNKKK